MDKLIELLEVWGSEEKIQKLQGLSYNKYDREDFDYEVEKRLITLLYEKKHMALFEFQGLTIKITQPIFVVRQWMRHRLFSYHEISRRYSKIKKEDLEILKNKFYPEEIYNELNRQIEFYNYLIESKDYKKELQRGVIGTYFPTTFLCSGNLRQWLHFFDMRLDSHQQNEIRMYADYIFNNIISKHFPIVHNLASV